MKQEKERKLPSWRSTPRARPQAEASRGLIPCLPFALWTPWMAPVGLSLAGYIMHNLRFCRVRGRKATPRPASGQASHGLGPGSPRPLTRVRTSSGQATLNPPNQGEMCAALGEVCTALGQVSTLLMPLILQEKSSNTNNNTNTNSNTVQYCCDVF